MSERVSDERLADGTARALIKRLRERAVKCDCGPECSEPQGCATLIAVADGWESDRARLAAWEPVVRAAMEWKRTPLMEWRLLEALDALPKEMRPMTLTDEQVRQEEREACLTIIADELDGGSDGPRPQDATLSRIIAAIRNRGAK